MTFTVDGQTASFIIPTSPFANMGQKLTVSEQIKKNKRMIDRAIRDMDKEQRNLEREQKRLENEIKKMAKQQQMVL